MKLHKYNSSAFSVFDFWTDEACHHLVQRVEKLGFEDATIDDGAGQVIDKAARNNQRVFLNDPVLAMSIWEQFSAFVPSEIDGWSPNGLNELFRIYKYDKYQSFKWHRDLPFIKSDDEKSLMTFMIYLNDDFEGGYTDFEDFKIWPQTGMAVCFNHKLRHEGAYVTEGTKLVLRSDIMFKRWS